MNTTYAHSDPCSTWFVRERKCVVVHADGVFLCFLGDPPETEALLEAKKEPADSHMEVKDEPADLPVEIKSETFSLIEIKKEPDDSPEEIKSEPDDPPEEIKSEPDSHMEMKKEVADSPMTGTKNWFDLRPVFGVIGVFSHFFEGGGGISVFHPRPNC